MAGSRKRKHVPSEVDATSKRQRAIKEFGTIGKIHTNDMAAAQKTKIVRPSTPPPPTSILAASKSVSKRKREFVSDSEDDSELGTATAKPSIFKQYTLTEAPSTKATRKKTKHEMPSSPSGTPRSEAATALFDRLKLESSKAIPFVFGANALNTPPETPEADGEASDGMQPNEVQELNELYPAFLTALSIHRAHNRDSSEVEVEELLQVITKTWRKRTVSLVDLQRLLGVEAGIGDFQLVNYGRAGVRLRIACSFSSQGKRINKCVDEDERTERFKRTLSSQWKAWRDDKHLSPGEFLNQLPLAKITEDMSAQRASTLLERGKQRLAQVKADRAAVEAKAPKNPVSVTAEQKSVTAVVNRGTSLLDRVMAKQNLAASLPAEPTQQERDRKAALHRIEDISRVLGLLAGTKSRITFSMPTITQQLQQSLRNPISRIEVEQCLRLLAEEVNPEFVRLVQSGTVQGVVISTIGRVGLDELRDRIRNASV